MQLRSAVYVKILLVDDSKAILRENERALHKAGYVVLCAEDGVSALEMAQRLVHTQADYLRKVVDSAGKSLTKPGGRR